ncbi:MAG: flagellar filament capping protein FliD, partial [Propionivibrio sp.]
GPDGTLPTGGTLTITLDTQSGSGEPSKTTDIEIADGATPEAVRDAINAASAGVSATVINGTAGKQLVLVADNPGSKQFIKLAGVAGLAYDPAVAEAPNDPFAQKQAAQGAEFLINGIAATADSNTVVTVIDGITLTLAKINVGEPTTLALTRDTSGLTTAVNAFVKAYNDVNTTSNNLGNYNAASKTAGALNGESIVRSAQNAFRSLLSNVPSELTDTDASLKTLSAIGVSVQKDGSLKVDAEKLKTAVDGDLTGVADVLAAYGSAFKTAADAIVGTTGTIAARTEGLNTAIKGLGKQSEALTARLAQIETRYRRQFLALDTLMSNMTQTSSFLQQQLANLPSINRSN